MEFSSEVEQDLHVWTQCRYQAPLQLARGTQLKRNSWAMRSGDSVCSTSTPQRCRRPTQEIKSFPAYLTKRDLSVLKSPDQHDMIKGLDCSGQMRSAGSTPPEHRGSETHHGLVGGGWLWLRCSLDSAYCSRPFQQMLLTRLVCVSLWLVSLELCFGASLQTTVLSY